MYRALYDRNECNGERRRSETVKGEATSKQPSEHLERDEKYIELKLYDDRVNTNVVITRVLENPQSAYSIQMMLPYPQRFWHILRDLVLLPIWSLKRFGDGPTSV